jgi:hypothetical protein
MKFAIGLLVAGIAMSWPGRVLAHHSFDAEYDAKKPIELKGVVTKLEWTNPHVRFYVDVKDAKGVVTSWDLELMSVNTLTRAGWTRTSLKIGDEVTVNAFLAKDGSHRANARGSVTLADGRKVFAGDPPTGGIPNTR